MIERVNFIERVPFVLTYRKMALTGAALFGAFFLLYGVQIARIQGFRKDLGLLSEEVSRLKAQKEAVLARYQKDPTGGTGVDEAIRKNLIELPRWSDILHHVTRLMPPGVWLVSLKSYPKEAASGGRGLLFSGEAEDARQISLFLKELKGSPIFENPILSTSKRETKGSEAFYSYTIDSGLGKSRRESL